MEESSEKDDHSSSPNSHDPVPIVSHVIDAGMSKANNIFSDFKDLGMSLRMLQHYHNRKGSPSPTKSQGSQSSPAKYPQVTSRPTESPTVSNGSPDLEIAYANSSASDVEDDQVVANSSKLTALIDCGEKTFNDEEEEMQEDEKYEHNTSDDGMDKGTENEVDNLGEKVGRWTFSKTTFVLPQYKPKQYSSFAEFRSALHGETSDAPQPPAPPTSLLPASLKTAILTDNHQDEAEEAPQGASEGSETSENAETIAGSTPQPATSTGAILQEEQKTFKLPANLPPLNPLRANENDIIDLGDDTVESTTDEETGLLRLMSRFSQQTRPPEEIPAAFPQKPVEFSILEKVTDKDTGNVQLVLDTVTYQPSAANAAVTSMNRREWRMHRRKLREILRSKRLKNYEERMKNYQPPQVERETEQVDPDEDDEWSAGDDNDCSSSSDSGDEDTDEEENDETEEDDSDSVHGASRARRDCHPLIDDEAEEEEGDEEEEDGCDAAEENDTQSAYSKVDAKTSSKEVSALSYVVSPQLEEPDDFTDLPNEAQSAHLKVLLSSSDFSIPAAGSTSSRCIPQRKCVEPGDIDLFASESTILPDKTFNISRALSSTRFEADPVQDSSMAIRSERSSWNDTPCSLLFSQKQPSICPASRKISAQALALSNDALGISSSSSSSSLTPSKRGTDAEGLSAFLAENTHSPSKLTQTDLCTVNGSLSSHTTGVSHEEGESLSTPPRDTTKIPDLGLISTVERRRRLRISGDEDEDNFAVSKEDAVDRLTKPSPQSPPFSGKKLLPPSIKTEPWEAKADEKLQLNSALDFLSAFEHDDNPDEADEDEEVEDKGMDGELEEDAKESDYATSDADEKDGKAHDLSGSDLEEAYLLDKVSHSEGKRPAKFDAKAFLEEEAELSGDEIERAQFADEDIDDDSDAGSLKDFVDEAEVDAAGKLRRQVERIHMRIQEDEDQREVRYLKELFLEDGDLFDEKGKIRERRFRWRGLENADPLSNNQVDMDETDEEDDETDDAASRWLSGGAGVMSRWLLHGAAETGSTEVADVQTTKPDGRKLTADKEASALASPPDRPGNLVLNLGKQALLRNGSHRSSQKESQKPLNFALPSVPSKLSQKLESEKMAEQPVLKKFSSTSCISSPPSLQNIRRGSFLLRSTSLFASNATGTIAQPSPQTVLSRTEVEMVNEQLLLLQDDNRSTPESCVLGLQSKVGLSCFSVNRAGGDDGVPHTANHHSRFSVYPSSQPAPATAAAFSQVSMPTHTQKGTATWSFLSSTLISLSRLITLLELRLYYWVSGVVVFVPPQSAQGRHCSW
ncbi:unnamed protein product [Schistocephalus solidus]|uniref:Claspin n=1 Tax=Schistocephalus solidus TaxID=70667 RepID=A0A183SIU3_SCHSO|nr:unnamed protein product [Schistocephalus solidus]